MTHRITRIIVDTQINKNKERRGPRLKTCFTPIYFVAKGVVFFPVCGCSALGHEIQQKASSHSFYHPATWITLDMIKWVTVSLCEQGYYNLNCLQAFKINPLTEPSVADWICFRYRFNFSLGSTLQQPGSFQLIAIINSYMKRNEKVFKVSGKY